MIHRRPRHVDLPPCGPHVEAVQPQSVLGLEVQPALKPLEAEDGIGAAVEAGVGADEAFGGGAEVAAQLGGKAEFARHD